MYHPDILDASPHHVRPIEPAARLVAFVEAIDDDTFTDTLFELALCILGSLFIALCHYN